MHDPKTCKYCSDEQRQKDEAKLMVGCGLVFATGILVCLAIIGVALYLIFKP